MTIDRNIILKYKLDKNFTILSKFKHITHVVSMEITEMSVRIW